MKFSLKLFLLLSLLVAMLVGYFGIRSEVHFMTARRDDQWESFAGELGYRGDGNGGIQLDGSGLALSASVRNLRQLSLLQEREQASVQITSLLVFGEKTYRDFDPTTCPNVEQLSVCQIELKPTSFNDLHLLPELRHLEISEPSINPAKHLATLKELPGLQHLDLFSAQHIPLEDFPLLEQLKLLTIQCPGIDAETQESLRERLPDCDVFFHAP